MEEPDTDPLYMDVLASQQESSSKGFIRVQAGRTGQRHRLKDKLSV
jgi:hypothetical protein